MACVVAFIPDLLFGSRVQAALEASGHEVDLLPSPQALAAALSAVGAPSEPTVLVVDLTTEPETGASLVESLAQQDLLDGVHTLGFYSHVDVEVRARAERAGFDLVIPRSRMAREGASLVMRLAEGG